MDLPDGEKRLTICLPVLTECTNVTDRHTHTDGHPMTAKAALDASIARQKLKKSLYEYVFAHPACNGYGNVLFYSVQINGDMSAFS